MDNREKVIKQLKWLVFNFPWQNKPKDESDKMCNAIHKYAHDAIELLETQVPRVLRLDEIHRGMAVWLEDIDKPDVVLAIGGASCGGAKCFIDEKDRSIAANDAEYNTRWRAWTQEPNDEQRKAEEWEERTCGPDWCELE